MAPEAKAAAARKLGWTEIEVRQFEGDETAARLWEIAENLHRADLTVAERAAHIAEWVRLTDGEKVSAQVGPKLPKRGVGQGVGGGRPEAGINAAVRKLGITRQEAQRAVKIDSMAPEAKAAAHEAGLDDNQSALLRTAREPSPAAQLAAIKREKKATEARKAGRHVKTCITHHFSVDRE